MAERSSLESIPGIGPKLARKLNQIGIFSAGDLRGMNPERLYAKLERVLGSRVDRCVLYVFRAAVYYADRKRHDPEKLKWWNWKDHDGS